MHDFVAENRTCFRDTRCTSIKGRSPVFDFNYSPCLDKGERVRRNTKM